MWAWLPRYVNVFGFGVTRAVTPPRLWEGGGGRRVGGVRQSWAHVWRAHSRLSAIRFSGAPGSVRSDCAPFSLLPVFSWVSDGGRREPSHVRESDRFATRPRVRRRNFIVTALDFTLMSMGASALKNQQLVWKRAGVWKRCRARRLPAALSYTFVWFVSEPGLPLYHIAQSGLTAPLHILLSAFSAFSKGGWGGASSWVS